jgi:hypothetical protein
MRNANERHNAEPVATWRASFLPFLLAHHIILVSMPLMSSKPQLQENETQVFLFTNFVDNKNGKG